MAAHSRRRRVRAVLGVLRGEASGLGGVLLAAGCAWAARGVRYGWIEPTELGAACESAGPWNAAPWWCGVRSALIVFTQWGGFGWLALGLCGAALLRARHGARRSGFAWAALAAGGTGLVLYNATLAAVAVVGAGLLLAPGSDRESDRPADPCRFPPGIAEPRQR